MPNMPAKTDLTGSVTQGQFKIAFNQMYDFLVEKLGSVTGVLKANQVNADAAGSLSAGTVATQLAALEQNKSPKNTPEITGLLTLVESTDQNKILLKGSGSNYGAIQSVGDNVWGLGSALSKTATPDKTILNWTDAGVGIGCPAPTTNRVFAVGGKDFAEMVIKSTASPGGSGGCYLQFGNSASETVGTISYAHSNNSMNFATNGSWRIFIDDTGSLRPYTDNSTSLGSSTNRWSQIWAANGTIQTSDARAKTDIAESALGLNFINKLRPVSYKFLVGENIVTQEPDGEEEVITQEEIKDTDGNITQKRIAEMRPKIKTVVTPRAGVRTHYGLIAQEVKEALGNVDFGGHVYDQESDSHGLRYEEFVSVLIKAVQELSKEVETLKAQIAK